MALQFQLQQSQWWSEEDHRRQQLAQVSRVLAHAQKTVPYYQKLLAGHDLASGPTFDWESFRRIPVSRRAALQEAGDSLFSTQPPKEHGQVTFKTTSGSTGRPLRFGATPLVGLYWCAFTLREHLWHRRDFARKLCAIRFGKPGVAEDDAGVSTPNWGVAIHKVFPTGPSSMLNVSRTPEQQLDWLGREQPDYLITFPSNLRALMTWAGANGRTLPKLLEIRTVGETLSPEDRERISRTWDTKVTDLYSCEEAGVLAAQCPDHEHYHVNAENIILEILDEQDRPCPVGTPGRVVITTLLNFASPLIRFDLGDVAELGAPCACGRGLPVLRRIHGRTRNRLMLPDGTTRYPRLGEEDIISLTPDAAIRQFKGIQHSYEKFELQVAARRPLTEAEQTTLAERLRVNLGHPFEIVFTFVDEIPAGPTGKRETFVSLIAR